MHHNFLFDLVDYCAVSFDALFRILKKWSILRG